MFGVPIHVANERVKGFAGICFNLSTVTVAGSIARFYTDGADLVAVALAVATPILIWAGAAILVLLDSVEEM